MIVLWPKKQTKADVKKKADCRFRFARTIEERLARYRAATPARARRQGAAKKRRQREQDPTSPS